MRHTKTTSRDSRGERIYFSLLLIVVWGVLLFLASLQATGQRNTLWLTHNPTDMALGLRYDRQISDLGLYIGGSYGNYRIDAFQRIDDHVKLSAGAIRYVPGTMNRTTLLYSIGLSYHHYGNTQYFDDLNRKVLFPLSVDLGAGARIKWFNAGFTMDFIKREGGFLFGVTF